MIASMRESIDARVSEASYNTQLPQRCSTLSLSLSLCLIHSARQVLMDGWHGDRPVTLIGYSVGARVVFRCLLELAAAGHSGCVEHAVLIAAPVSPHATHWAAARCVVAGRLANVWSERDCLLGVLHRLQVTPQPLPVPTCGRNATLYGTGGARTRCQPEANRQYGSPRPFSRGALGPLGELCWLLGSGSGLGASGTRNKLPTAL